MAPSLCRRSTLGWGAQALKGRGCQVCADIERGCVPRCVLEEVGVRGLQQESQLKGENCCKVPRNTIYHLLVRTGLVGLLLGQTGLR